jgi:hypothetical protein
MHQQRNAQLGRMTREESRAKPNRVGKLINNLRDSDFSRLALQTYFELLLLLLTKQRSVQKFSQVLLNSRIFNLSSFHFLIAVLLQLFLHFKTFLVVIDELLLLYPL